MKWFSHRAVSGISTLALTQDFTLSIMVGTMSCFPDQIEFLFYRKETEWKSKHRTWFHWFVPYLVILCLVYLFLSSKEVFLHGFSSYANAMMIVVNSVMSAGTISGVNPSVLVILVLNIIFWLCVASLLHIAEDAICGKIPLFSPKKFVRFPRLFYVGTWQEYAFVFGFCAIVINFGCNFLIDDAKLIQDIYRLMLRMI